MPWARGYPWSIATNTTRAAIAPSRSRPPAFPSSALHNSNTTRSTGKRGRSARRSTSSTRRRLPSRAWRVLSNKAPVETRVPTLLLGEQAIGASAFSVFSQDVVTKSVYDAAGNEVQAIDARGNSSFCYYNRLGQKILEVDPEKYVTRWEYDAAGNVIRTTQYANKLSLTAAITSDVAALIANVGASSDDRVTEFDYDRLGRVTERRVLNVQYGTVDANGVLASASAGARTRFQYNGLGQVTQQTDADGAVTDLSYDAAGRRLREQDAQFTDFEGAAVRPTTDFEYDGLNQVKRQLVRGKDNATEGDDRITAYQYDYGFGARLTGKTDPTLSTTSFFYDV